MWNLTRITEIKNKTCKYYENQTHAQITKLSVNHCRSRSDKLKYKLFKRSKQILILFATADLFYLAAFVPVKRNCIFMSSLWIRMIIALSSGKSIDNQTIK